MDLPEAQGSRHTRESKSGIPEIVLSVESGILETLIGEFGILGFGMRNPRRGIQNTRLFCFPLYGATSRCSHTSTRSVISNEDGSRGDINKVKPGKV